MIDHTALREATRYSPKVLVQTADLLALLADYDALVAAGVKKPKAAAKKAAKKAADAPAEIPDWMPLEAWEAFLAMRVKIKKPATEYAKRLLVMKLERFRAQGLDPAQIINQSVESCWQDLYAPKESMRGYGYDPAPNKPARHGIRNFRAEQQAAANQEALDRLNGVPMFDPNVIDVEAAYVAD